MAYLAFVTVNAVIESAVNFALNVLPRVPVA